MRYKRPRYWLNLTLFTLGALAAGLGFAFVYGSYRGAVMYVHPPRSALLPGDTPARFEVPYSDVELITRDGLRLRAWYTPPKNNAVILVAHGYAAGRSSGMHALFAMHGFGVLSWDARAHGTSEGEVSTFGYIESYDVEAALNFAQTQPDVQHVGAWGGSMGAATVLHAAAQLPGIEAVVADSAYPAISEMIGKVSPLPGMAPFIQFFAEQQTGLNADELRPIDHIAQISPRPVFLIQGADDKTVPSDSAQRLYAAAREPKELWIESGIGHVAMFDTHRDEYTQRVIEFFTLNLSAQP